MDSSFNQERHSVAEAAELITDPDEKARREARNALKQIDTVYKLVEDWTQPERSFRLRPSAILRLHRDALDGISRFAGNYRAAGVSIGGSAHEPPGAYLVPELIEELCDYVNNNLDKSAIHLASYVLWRINWIHPFDDGNGCTARAVSYFVLCAVLGYRLPGANTIPEQIATNKHPYYTALEKADSAYQNGSIDVSDLERYLEGLLAQQLVNVYQQASGNSELPR